MSWQSAALFIRSLWTCTSWPRDGWNDPRSTWSRGRRRKMPQKFSRQNPPTTKVLFLKLKIPKFHTLGTIPKGNIFGSLQSEENLIIRQNSPTFVSIAKVKCILELRKSRFATQFAKLCFLVHFATNISLRFMDKLRKCFCHT